MINTNLFLSKGKYKDIEVEIKPYSIIDEIFDLWLKLTSEEKLKFAEKKINWYNKNINN